MHSNARRMLRVAALLACGFVFLGMEPSAKPKVRVELRWVEQKRIDGLTEANGFQSSCDPDSIVYPHAAPALVLTPTEVAEARLKSHDLSGSGLSSENHMVTLHLTKQARDKLAATCDPNDRDMRLLTVVVDGKFWGIHRYEIDPDKPFVPEQARAASFTPSVGFFSSKFEAQRVVDALRATDNAER